MPDLPILGPVILCRVVFAGISVFGVATIVRCLLPDMAHLVTHFRQQRFQLTEAAGAAADALAASKLKAEAEEAQRCEEALVVRATSPKLCSLLSPKRHMHTHILAYSHTHTNATHSYTHIHTRTYTPPLSPLSPLPSFQQPPTNPFSLLRHCGCVPSLLCAGCRQHHRAQRRPGVGTRGCSA